MSYSVKCFRQVAFRLEDGDTEPFQLTLRKIEKAYTEATSKGLTVRGIILTNPNNPLGVMYSKQLLKEILHFAKQHELHVVSDEIYALSLFNTQEKFTSILSLDDIPDPDRTHVLWGFSKDFGLSGFRCGIIHTRNQSLHKFLHNTALFEAVPYIVQTMLEKLIRDKDWLDTVYFPLLYTRMKDNYDLFVNCFNKFGIPVFQGSGRATCFIWVDFSKYVRPLNSEGEGELFTKLMDSGVYIVPGSKLGCEEFGWFRIVFTHYKGHCMKAVERMEKLFTELDKVIVPQSAHQPAPRTICLDDLGLGDLAEQFDAHLENHQNEPKDGASAGAHEDDLASLVGTLQTQIRQSGWLEKNTPETFEKENPRIAAIFKEVQHGKSAEQSLESLSSELHTHIQTTEGASSGGGGDDLDLASLVGQLKSQIRQSDWLETNTAEKFEHENPEVAAMFRNAKQSKSD